MSNRSHCDNLSTDIEILNESNSNVETDSEQRSRSFKNIHSWIEQLMKSTEIIIFLILLVLLQLRSKKTAVRL